MCVWGSGQYLGSSLSLSSRPKGEKEIDRTVIEGVVPTTIPRYQLGTTMYVSEWSPLLCKINLDDLSTSFYLQHSKTGSAIRIACESMIEIVSAAPAERPSKRTSFLI